MQPGKIELKAASSTKSSSKNQPESLSLQKRIPEKKEEDKKDQIFEKKLKIEPTEPPKIATDETQTKKILEIDADHEDEFYNEDAVAGYHYDHFHQYNLSKKY